MSKITSYAQLTAALVANGDMIPIVDVDNLSMAPTGTTEKIAASDLFLGISGFVGQTASGHPTGGPYAVGNWAVDQTGAIWICTAAGSPGTWVSVGGSGSVLTTLGDMLYENGTPANARLAGNTTATKNFLTQTGTGSVSAAPAWGTIAAGDLPAATTGAQGAIKLPAASASFKPTNPTGTASTTEVMMGMGSTIAFTPNSSGKVIVTVCCIVNISAGAANQVQVGGRFGTGTAPANAAAVTGTVFGPTSDPNIRVNNVSASVGTPYTVTDRLSLTAGTAYWFDLAVAAQVGTNTNGVINVVAVIAEQDN